MDGGLNNKDDIMSLYKRVLSYVLILLCVAFGNPLWAQQLESISTLALYDGQDRENSARFITDQYPDDLPGDREPGEYPGHIREPAGWDPATIRVASGVNPHAHG